MVKHLGTIKVTDAQIDWIDSNVKVLELID